MYFERSYDPKDPVLRRLREFCSALPQTHDEETWGLVTFRIDRKLFAAFGRNAGVERALIVKPHPDDAIALEADPRFFTPSHFKTWLGFDLDHVDDWEEVRELLVDSFALIAPKDLAHQATAEAMSLAQCSVASHGRSDDAVGDFQRRR